MSSEPIISVHGVSKCYRLYGAPQDRLKQMLLRGRKQYFKEFWALRDVSFSIPAGSSVGIMGRNGAGKSSLLQIVSGVLNPSEGSLEVNGRISALLELGTGFNGDFTGRENIVINASIIGLSQKEIAEKMEPIIEFADIGDFIDQPVKTYSSGMFLRLAFAVAINVDPQILIVDEALAVGDAKFQAKCFRKFAEFREQKKTILFVSHSTDQVVRHCDRALLFDGGRLVEDGDPKFVANRYLDLLFGVEPGAKKKGASLNGTSQAKTANSDESVAIQTESIDLKQLVKEAQKEESGFEKRPGYNSGEYRWGNGKALLTDYMICSGNRSHVNHVAFDEEMSVTIYCKFLADVERPIYGLTIKTPDGVTVYGNNSRDLDGTRQFEARKAGDTEVVTFRFIPRLISGHYFLSLGIAEEDHENVVPCDRRYDAIELYVTNPKRSFGLAELDLRVEVLS